MKQPVKFNKNDPRTFKYNNDDFSPIHPSDNIVCRDCVFRQKVKSDYPEIDRLDYKSLYCEKYIKTHRLAPGKPYAVLFENAKCDFYKKEK